MISKDEEIKKLLVKASIKFANERMNFAVDFVNNKICLRKTELNEKRKEEDS